MLCFLLPLSSSDIEISVHLAADLSLVANRHVLTASRKMASQAFSILIREEGHHIQTRRLLDGWKEPDPDEPPLTQPPGNVFGTVRVCKIKIAEINRAFRQAVSMGPR